eukprot:3563588-Pyramimonas_sp.AAC.1
MGGAEGLPYGGAAAGGGDARRRLRDPGRAGATVAPLRLESTSRVESTKALTRTESSLFQPVRHAARERRPVFFEATRQKSFDSTRALVTPTRLRADSTRALARNGTPVRFFESYTCCCGRFHDERVREESGAVMEQAVLLALRLVGRVLATDEAFVQASRASGWAAYATFDRILWADPRKLLSLLEYVCYPVEYDGGAMRGPSTPSAAYTA